jgi:hypothetical protein
MMIEFYIFFLGFCLVGIAIWMHRNNSEPIPKTPGLFWIGLLLIIGSIVGGIGYEIYTWLF